MVDTTLIIVVFLLLILTFTLGMLGLLIYMWWEQRRKQKQEQEQIEQQPNEVPAHIRQRNFDDFIKEQLRKGVLDNTDRSYRILRKELLHEVDLELKEHKERKQAEAEKEPPQNTRREIK